MARGLRYTLGFTDREGAAVEIRIDEEGWEGASVELTPGASPLTLQEDDTEGLDTPSRAWTGRLTVVAEPGVDLSGLYAPEVTSSRVTVRRGGQTVWLGYLSPAVVRQDWVAGGEVTVSVQSPLAAMEGLTLDASAGFGYVTLGALLQEVARLTGDWSHVVFPDDISVPGSSDTAGWLDVMTTRYAFFSTHEETRLTSDGDVTERVYRGNNGRDVLKALCRLLGWTASERAGVLWLSAESAPGYLSVAVSELATPSRTVSGTAAAELSLDDLTPAGTEHTLSHLKGVRNVRVSFSADTRDDLLDGLDAYNWTRTGEVAFEEDNRYEIASKSDDGTTTYEDAGYYVSVHGWDTMTTLTTVAAQYRFARFSQTSLDGGSSGHLYTARRTRSDQSWGNLTAGVNGERVNWAWNESASVSTYDRYSWVGGEFSWMRARFGEVNLLPISGHDLLFYAGKSWRDNGVIIWTAADKKEPLGDLSSRAFFTTKSVAPCYMPGGALRLSAKFCGYLSCDEPSLPVPFTLTKLGPWTVTKFDAIKQWRLRLKIGGKYWDGAKWTDSPAAFTVTLDGDAENSYSEIAGTGRVEDPEVYLDADEGYIIPLTDSAGNDLIIHDAAELTIYGPTGNTSGQGEAYFNPIMIYEISLAPLRKRELYNPYEKQDAESTHNYIASTGCESTDEEHGVDFYVGTWTNDRSASNVLIRRDWSPITAFRSLRQGGMVARPERLVLSVLRRLYGRARRQLSVEVDAAGIEPGAVIRDGQTRYALTGVEWDLREAKCKYTLEDYIPFDQWAG